MPTPSPRNAEGRCIGLWVTLAAALVYCAWLGAHWLPIGMSEHELAASASRVWDVKRELAAHHGLPWWTPWFMSGSSYGLNHSRGFYLAPWLLFSKFTELITAGKLVALLAIFGSAVTMYFCARYFLRAPLAVPSPRPQGEGQDGRKTEWAAALAAIAYMLHPEQIIRAAGAEHITISLFFPFIPLLWWTFARMLESGRLRDVFWCALTAVMAMWTDNKQAVIQFFFLFFYLVHWLWPASRRGQWKTTARLLAMLAAVGLTLGAAVIVPGVVESKYVKLFIGDPLTDWQKTYAFRSLFALVDREGVVTRNVAQAAMTKAQTQGVTSQAQVDAVRRVISMQMESPEKYAGIVVLLVVAVTVLFNSRRANRGLFWLFVSLLLLSVMLATGFGNIWIANLKTFDALSSWAGVPLAVWLALVVVVVFLALFARRKLTTPRKWWIAAGALATFLFLPGFGILSSLPYFKEIRAPFVFYDGPATFWCAMLAGFFVTDVLVGRASRLSIAVAVMAVLLLVDYWPYQRPMKDSGVPTRTIQNLQTAYGALQTDNDWVKTYSVSGRYFHLLGPMYGGKPQVWEAFYNWMAPLGTGLLNQHAFENHAAFLNLVGARYMVFDKTDPGAPQMQRALDFYRKTFPVAVENDDFTVFRNNNAWPYVSAFARKCLYIGDLRAAPPLALALAARNLPLVHADNAGDVSAERMREFEKVYREGDMVSMPLIVGEPVTLQNVELRRESNGQVRIKLTAPVPCLAVINESYFPFWRAEVDGQPVDLLRVNCALMGIELPAGQHEIVLRYQKPQSYAVAGFVSLLALIVGVGRLVRRKAV